MFSELTFKHVDSADDIRSRFDRESKKLQRRLNHFPDDGVQLSGVVDSRVGKELYTWSLNLRLPGRTIHTTKEGYKILESMDAAFDDVSKQLEKYITQLRREHFWKKGRAQSIKTPAQLSVGEEELEFVEEAESDWM